MSSRDNPPPSASFTAEQAATANTVLRRALGLGPESFSVEQFVGMVSDEIEQLRAAGQSDREIAALLAQAQIEVDPADLERYFVSERGRGR